VLLIQDNILDTRIVIVDNNPIRKIHPVGAIVDLALGEDLASRSVCHARKLVGLLEHKEAESLTDVPRDVAVEGPDAWVVLVPLHDNVSTRKELLDVTTLGVVGARNGSIPAIVGRAGDRSGESGGAGSDVCRCGGDLSDL